MLISMYQILCIVLRSFVCCFIFCFVLFTFFVDICHTNASTLVNQPVLIMNFTTSLTFFALSFIWQSKQSEGKCSWVCLLEISININSIVVSLLLFVYFVYKYSCSVYCCIFVYLLSYFYL